MGDSDSDSGHLVESSMRLRNVEIIRQRSNGSANSGLKYLSLFVLVFQNASQVLLIRYARTRQKQEMFLSTSAVFFTEILKLATCILIVSVQERSFFTCISSMYRQILLQPLDTLKVCVPSMIYTIQNNLLYIAVSNLAAATFMVTYQLKILTTALFSVLMLKKSLSKLQWLSLLMLFIGVSVVQLQEQQDNNSRKLTAASTVSPFVGLGNSTASPIPTIIARPAQSPMVGLGCVVTACLLSGFAGVYFEKILKGSEITVWMRNIQLAVLSVPIAYLTMEAKDGSVVRQRGMLYGYDTLVWVIVIVYAVGGLTVAVVIKYADNILKGFATSVAIIVSCVVSIYLFKFMPSLQFLGGTSLVISSIYMYSKFPFVEPAKDVLKPPPVATIP